MKNRRLTSMAAIVALTAVANVLIPAEAYADGPTYPNPNCKLVAGKVSESVDFVTGTGRVVTRRGCGTDDVKVYVSRSRWYGWEKMASTKLTENGTDYRVRYDCTGTGTHDFRIEVEPVGHPEYMVSSAPLKGVICSN